MKKQNVLYPNDVYIGEARSDTIRSKEKWMFQYAPEYLDKSRPLLDTSIANVRGSQFPANGDVFGFLSDVAPDRWGRKLIRRRERRDLLESDFMLGVSDLTRQGALRLKLDRDGPFAASELLSRVWSTRREFSQRIDAPNTEI